MHIKHTKTKFLTVRIDEYLYEELKLAADNKPMTISKYVTSYLQARLQEELPDDSLPENLRRARKARQYRESIDWSTIECY